MAPIGPWTSELCAAVVVQVIHSQPLSRRLFSLKAIPGLGAACTSLLLVTPVSLSTIMRDGSKDSKTTRTRYIGVRCFLRCTMNMFFFQHFPTFKYMLPVCFWPTGVWEIPPSPGERTTGSGPSALFQLAEALCRRCGLWLVPGLFESLS